MSTASSMKVAIVQCPLVWEAPQENLNHFTEVFERIEPGTHLVCLPEMFTTGFTMNAAQHAEDMEGHTVRWLNDMSRKRGFAIVSTHIVRQSDAYYNRFCLSVNGEIAATYDKRHLFRMAGESDVFTPGYSRRLIFYEGWQMMPRVCYDLRFPVWNRSIHADIQVYLANWPEARIDAWDKLLMARAIENQCYVIGVNRIGTDGTGKDYPGHSIVIDPKGNPLTEVNNGKEETIYAELKWNELDEYRQKFPLHLDADEFEILP